MTQLLKRWPWPSMPADDCVSIKAVKWKPLTVQTYKKGCEFLDLSIFDDAGLKHFVSITEKHQPIVITPQSQPFRVKMHVRINKPIPGPVYAVKAPSVRLARELVLTVAATGDLTDGILQFTPTGESFVHGDYYTECAKSGPSVLEDASLEHTHSEYVVELDRNELGDLAPTFVHQYFHLPSRMFAEYKKTGVLVARAFFYLMDGQGTAYQRVTHSFAVITHLSPMPTIYKYECIFKAARLLSQGKTMEEILGNCPLKRLLMARCMPNDPRNTRMCKMNTGDADVGFDRLKFLEMVERERKVSYCTASRPMWKSHFMAALAYRDANTAPHASNIVDLRRAAGESPDDEVTLCEEEPAPDMAAAAAVRMSGRSKASVVRSVLLDVASTKMLENELLENALGGGSGDVPLPACELRYVEAFDGVRLAFRVYEPQRSESSDARFVNAVLLGGLGTTTRRRELLGDSLRRYGVRSFVLDYRGHGGSGGVPGTAPTPDAFLRDVRSVVRHVSWNYPTESTVLVGHGLGANIAINYAQWGDRVPVNGYVFLSPLLPFAIRRDNRECRCVLLCRCARNMQLTADADSSASEMNSSSSLSSSSPKCSTERHSSHKIHFSYTLGARSSTSLASGSTPSHGAEATSPQSFGGPAPVRFGESMALGLLLRLNHISGGKIAGDAVALDVSKGLKKVEERVREVKETLRRHSVSVSATTSSPKLTPKLLQSAFHREPAGALERETDGSVRSKTSITDSTCGGSTCDAQSDATSLGGGSLSSANGGVGIGIGKGKAPADAVGTDGARTSKFAREGSDASDEGTDAAVHTPATVPAEVSTDGVLPPSVPKRLSINVVQSAIVRKSVTVFERIDRPFGLWVGEKDEFIATKMLFPAAERSVKSRCVETIPHADHLSILADADWYVGPFLKANFAMPTVAC
eukprot:Opistho-2@22594